MILSDQRILYELHINYSLFLLHDKGSRLLLVLSSLSSLPHVRIKLIDYINHILLFCTVYNNVFYHVSYMYDDY